MEVDPKMWQGGFVRQSGSETGDPKMYNEKWRQKGMLVNGSIKVDPKVKQGKRRLNPKWTLKVGGEISFQDAMTIKNLLLHLIEYFNIRLLK